MEIAVNTHRLSKVSSSLQKFSLTSGYFLFETVQVNILLDVNFTFFSLLVINSRHLPDSGEVKMMTYVLNRGGENLLSGDLPALLSPVRGRVTVAVLPCSCFSRKTVATAEWEGESLVSVERALLWLFLHL